MEVDGADEAFDVYVASRGVSVRIALDLREADISTGGVDVERA